jgi:hypothetical protein
MPLIYVSSSKIVDREHLYVVVVAAAAVVVGFVWFRKVIL